MVLFQWYGEDNTARNLTRTTEELNLAVLSRADPNPEPSESKHARGRIRIGSVFTKSSGRRETFAHCLWRSTSQRRSIYFRWTRFESIFHDGRDTANPRESEPVFLLSLHKPNRIRVLGIRGVEVHDIASLRFRSALERLLSVSVRGTRGVRHRVSVWTQSRWHLPLVSGKRLRYRSRVSVRSWAEIAGVSL